MPYSLRLDALRLAMLAGAVVLPVASGDAQTGDSQTGPGAPASVAGQLAPTAPVPTAPATIPDAAAGMEQIAADQVVAVLGIAVRSTSGGGTDVGRIVDVLVDGAGQPRAAVVDVGGFLGVGSRKVALEWKMLRFTLGKTPAAVLAVPSDRIKSAPTYDPAKPVEMIEAKPVEIIEAKPPVAAH